MQRTAVTIKQTPITAVWQRLLIVCALFSALPTPALAQDAHDQTESSATMPAHSYTYHQASGNRFVQGAGRFPDVQALDFQLDITPDWVLLYERDNTLEVQVTELQTGLTQSFRQTDRNLTFEISAGPQALYPAQAVPLVVNPADAAPAPELGSSLSHPVPIAADDDTAQYVYVADDGALVLWRDGGDINRLLLNVQPDARLVVNDHGQIALYADATNQRYVHAIMGDDLEGAALVVLEVVDKALVAVARVDLPGDSIYEGLAPLWADIDGDGVQDVVTTVANRRGGAQVRAYLFDGQQFTREVDGPAIGQGFRWRHQLAWGAFGTDGENELVEVLTPHIGGVVGFYRYTGDALQIVARAPGYTSHIINSRNLDMAVAADFNGDGTPELAVPTQDRRRVVGLQRVPDGVREVWSLSVGSGRVISNLSALALTDGGLALAIGTDDNRLRVWVPRS